MAFGFFGLASSVLCVVGFGEDGEFPFLLVVFWLLLRGFFFVRGFFVDIFFAFGEFGFRVGDEGEFVVFFEAEGVCDGLRVVGLGLRRRAALGVLLLYAGSLRVFLIGKARHFLPGGPVLIGEFVFPDFAGGAGEDAFVDFVFLAEYFSEVIETTALLGAHRTISMVASTPSGRAGLTRH